MYVDGGATVSLYDNAAVHSNTAVRYVAHFEIV